MHESLKTILKQLDQTEQRFAANGLQIGEEAARFRTMVTGVPVRKKTTPTHHWVHLYGQCPKHRRPNKDKGDDHDHSYIG